MAVLCYGRSQVEENTGEAKEEIREAEEQDLLLHGILVMREASTSIRTTLNCLWGWSWPHQSILTVSYSSLDIWNQGLGT